MERLSELGLWGLGLSAFLAATILPFNFELVLSALLLAGENPLAVIIIAIIGNVAGSIVNYLIGLESRRYTFAPLVSSSTTTNRQS